MTVCTDFTEIWQSVQILQKYDSHFQILDARGVRWKNFHTEDSQFWSELWHSVILIGSSE